MEILSLMPRLKGFRVLREILSYAVWAYHRFALSTAGVEDRLAERGRAILTPVSNKSAMPVMPLWVMVDELNAEIFETSFTLESREPYGAFSSAFTDAIVRGIHKSQQVGKTHLTQRK